MSDFSCADKCQYAGKPWPRHMPTPTCRLFADFEREQNPVTKASLRQAIRNRIKFAPDCEPKEVK